MGKQKETKRHIYNMRAEGGGGEIAIFNIVIIIVSGRGYGYRFYMKYRR